MKKGCTLAFQAEQTLLTVVFINGLAELNHFRLSAKICVKMRIAVSEEDALLHLRLDLAKFRLNSKYLFVCLTYP